MTRSSESLAVYDGGEFVGALEDRGPRKVEAFVIVGGKRRRSLGIFQTRIDAMRAIPKAGESTR